MEPHIDVHFWRLNAPINNKHKNKSNKDWSAANAPHIEANLCELSVTSWVLVRLHSSSVRRVFVSCHRDRDHAFSCSKTPLQYWSMDFLQMSGLQYWQCLNNWECSWMADWGFPEICTNQLFSCLDCEDDWTGRDSIHKKKSNFVKKKIQFLKSCVFTHLQAKHVLLPLR